MSLEDPNNRLMIRGALREKRVHQVSDKISAVIHRAKVVACTYRRWMVLDPSEDVPLGTLRLGLNTKRQRLQSFKLGIFDAREVTSSHVIAAVADWVVEDRVAMLTVFSPRIRNWWWSSHTPQERCGNRLSIKVCGRGQVVAAVADNTTSLPPQPTSWLSGCTGV